MYGRRVEEEEMKKKDGDYTSGKLSSLEKYRVMQTWIKQCQII